MLLAPPVARQEREDSVEKGQAAVPVEILEVGNVAEKERANGQRQQGESQASGLRAEGRLRVSLFLPALPPATRERAASTQALNEGARGPAGARSIYLDVDDWGRDPRLLPGGPLHPASAAATGRASSSAGESGAAEHLEAILPCNGGGGRRRKGCWAQ